MLNRPLYVGFDTATERKMEYSEVDVEGVEDMVSSIRPLPAEWSSGFDSVWYVNHKPLKMGGKTVPDPNLQYF